MWLRALVCVVALNLTWVNSWALSSKPPVARTYQRFKRPCVVNNQGLSSQLVAVGQGLALPLPSPS